MGKVERELGMVEGAGASAKGKDARSLQIAAMGKTAQKALTLLANGTEPSSVANYLGVDASRISQFLADANFAQLLGEMKFEKAQKFSQRDDKLDAIQDTLTEKLETAIDMVYKPMEVMKLLKDVASIPRRSQPQVQQQVTPGTQVVTINLPTLAVNMFVQKTANNQVIQSGDQTLVTMQSSEVLARFGPEDAVKDGLKVIDPLALAGLHLP